jgi:anaphase-promoting complex subunit 1
LISLVIEHLDDRMPVWPIDMSALLYGRINNPDWKIPWHDTAALSSFFNIEASFEYGRLEPLGSLYLLTRIYMSLADENVKETQKRADNALHMMVKAGMGIGFIDNLPLGVAAPLREAVRTCQLSPPGEWPVAAYRIIGRNDLAAGASHTPDMLFNDGYKSMKDCIVSVFTISLRFLNMLCEQNASSSRRSVSSLVSRAGTAGAGEIEAVSGVELDLEGFTEIRFGQDRRLEEVARMLCSSNIPSVRIAERPELK